MSSRPLLNTPLRASIACVEPGYTFTVVCTPDALNWLENANASVASKSYSATASQVGGHLERILLGAKLGDVCQFSRSGYLSSRPFPWGKYILRYHSILAGVSQGEWRLYHPSPGRAVLSMTGTMRSMRTGLNEGNRQAASRTSTAARFPPLCNHMGKTIEKSKVSSIVSILFFSPEMCFSFFFFLLFFLFFVVFLSFVCVFGAGGC